MTDDDNLFTSLKMTLRLKYRLALLLLIFPLATFAQVEIKDSLSLGVDGGLPIPHITDKNDSIANMSRQFYPSTNYYPAVEMLPGSYPADPLDLHIPDLHFTPGQATLLHWKNGGIIASGGTQSFPGLMQIDNGAFGFYQSAGNFTFYAGGVANKYGYFNGLATQYGLNGSISYHIAPGWTATLFGDFYFGQPPLMANGMSMPPSMAGYYGRSKAGGYLDYQINERWGVCAGVQSVQQIGSNRYEAEPIVTPYYKISKKVSIGLPVGQILYHVLKRK